MPLFCRGCRPGVQCLLIPEIVFLFRGIGGGEVMALTDLTGDLVRIDLTTRQILRAPCPEALLRDYLGGRGLAVRLLLEHLPASTRPLGPENMLIFASGLLGGTRMITTGRLHIGARSP